MMRCIVQKIYKIVLIAGLISLAFLLPELLSRLFLPEWKPPVSDKPSLFVHNPHTGWMHPASDSLDHYGGTITSNYLGLRDPEPGDKTRPRVLFLGDSFTWGWSIGNNRDRYTDKLQAYFGDYQFINAGVIGFNTLQEFLLLRHYNDELKPDYVVLQMFANDFPENLTPEGIYPRPYLDGLNGMAIANHPSPEESRNPLDNMIIYLGESTYFYRQLIIRILSTLLASGIHFEEQPYEPRQADLSRGMKTALGLIMEFTADHNIPLLVVFSAMEDYQAEVIESVALQYRVGVVNLDPAFDSAAGEWKDHTQHWNQYGNELAAQYLKPHIATFLHEAR